ncbi:hypothetical protein F0919_01360 [Taibaiella lutea]|uniref:DUF6314 domain-containing protein n=1 Tax=Taibaiella lutea TaxID=2608001 RepID=A0A5M6CMR4_9BACT|nr:DUF6314 family protein [Taibaiella lutea]KAA5536343.1 hypothetical protein F0919_01360 [Taibaiella lutea]
MFESLELYFKGIWQFEREIIFSDSSRQYAKANGEATFEQLTIVGNELNYRENGKVFLENAGRGTSFFRAYKYVVTDDGLDIYFQDELTQNFNIYQSYIYQSGSHSLIARDKHLCNKDIYEGRFLLNDASHFVHTTLIKGPHKDYFITTHFNKL